MTHNIILVKEKAIEDKNAYRCPNCEQEKLARSLEEANDLYSGFECRAYEGWGKGVNIKV